MRPGDRIPPRVMGAIDLPRIREFMELMGDVNPVHDDEALVERLGLRGPVNQGPANLAYVLNAVIDWIGDADRLERLDFRFLDVVTTGDSVTASGVVRDVEGDGTAVADLRLDRDDGVQAVTASARIRPIG